MILERFLRYVQIDTMSSEDTGKTPSTNKQFDLIKKILTTLLGASCVALTNVKASGGFFSGLMSGFNLFRKKGDKKCQ